jgi:hypothetical protein
VNAIPKDLMANAKVVIRDYDVRFDIKSTENGVLKIKEVYTIINKAGLEYSKFRKGYNKYMSITDIKAVFYDENGFEIKKSKNSEIYDFPAISGYSLYEDTRVKYYDPKVESFPFTVEYTYKIKFNGLFSYPSWDLSRGYNVSLERSTFQVIIPTEIDFRFHAVNLSAKPVISYDNPSKIYTWSIEKIPAIKNEVYSRPFDELASRLYIAPNRFKIGGYEGCMETWQEFGDWISKLNKGRNNLPEETKIKIKALVQNASSDEEKVDVLYKYLQNKTRYVNIAVGMGGWQTLKTETVDRLSYGDCKALSFYMKSLLETVGVKSYYTLVKAGKNTSDILTEFPMNQFNHAMLCVPSVNDTIWLECTSQIVPTGYIGNFTNNRNVLLIDGENSRIARTPKYSIENNVTKRIIDFDIDESGGGKTKINVEYRELASDNMMQRTEYSDDDNKKWLYDNINIQDFIVSDVSYSVERNKEPVLLESIELDIKNYITTMGNQMIIPANVMNKVNIIPIKTSFRKSDIIVDQSSYNIDSVSFRIPENYSIDFVPEDILIRSKYGEYTAEFDGMGDYLIYKRNFKFYYGKYNSDEYDNFREFLKRISKADSKKFVIKKI